VLFSTRRVLPVAATGLALLVGACGDGGGKAVSSNCRPKYTVKTQQQGVLRVGAIQYPPYSTIKGGRAGGIDGQIMAGFAKAACLKLEAQETTFAAAVSSVTTRRNDVAMGDLYRTKERAQAVGLSNPVYLDQLGIVSKTGLGSMSALEGKKISTVQGYYFVAAVKKTFGKSVKLFPDNVKMYQDLFAGRSEAALDSLPAAVEYLKSLGKDGDYQVKVPPVDPRIPATGAQAAQSAYAYASSAHELGDGLNAYLEDIRSSGALAKILAANGIPASAAQAGKPRLS